MTQSVFLLPGWSLGRGPLMPLAAALGGKVLDLPGYGATPFTPDFDLAVEDLAARLPTQSVLIAWSLGSLFALAVAARHPKKCRQLVLIASTASFAQRRDWPHGMPSDQLAVFREGVAQDADAALPKFVMNFNRGDAQARQVSRELLRMADPLPDTAVLLTGLDWLRDIDLRVALKQVICPTLLIHGAQDPLMPLEASQALASKLAVAQLHIFDNSAHAPFLAHQDACVSLIQEFLRGNAG